MLGPGRLCKAKIFFLLTEIFLGSQFSFSGNASPSYSSFYLNKSLYDNNNVLLIDSANGDPLFDTNEVFGYSKTATHILQDVTMTWEVSASNEPFNPLSHYLYYRFGSGTFQPANNNINTTIFSSTQPGWFKYIFKTVGLLPFSTSYYSTAADNSIAVYVTASKIYNFRNIEIKFKEYLTDAGVAYYRTIDNTNNDDIFSYINAGVVKKIE